MTRRSAGPSPYALVSLLVLTTAACSEDEAKQVRRPITSARSEPRPTPGPRSRDASLHRTPRWTPRPDDVARPAVGIELPHPSALDRFYASLARTERTSERAMTRIVHMGDSSIGLDQLTHMLRRRMQRRFGDGGPGFMLLQPHSTSYRHTLAHPQVLEDWRFCFIIFRCKRDGHYGLGGVTVESNPGSATRFRTATRGDHGRNVSHFELWYAAQPNGGKLSVQIDREPPVTIDTASNALADRWWRADRPLGAHSMLVRAASGPVRAYGVVLEAERGVVWDNMSMIGAFTHRLLAYDRAHLREQLRQRQTDLLILSYGGNDLRRLASGTVTIPELQQEIRAVIDHARSETPTFDCLLMSIIDHGMSGARTITHREVEAVVAAQRQASLDGGCGFFDVYQTMGGRGSLQRWLAATPPLAAGDFKHLNARGRDVIAENLHRALMNGYAEYRAKH